MRARRDVLGALAAVALVGACHRAGGSAALAGSCAPPARTEPVMMGAVAGLAGGFRLVAVATSGPQAGRQASGRLDLRAQAERLQPFPEPGPAATTSQVLVGRTDLVAAEVGAVAMGDASADDPTMPGVGVYVAPGEGGSARSVVLRVGDRSNARGMQPIDAGYFAFHVQRVGPEGFQGVWMSGDGREEVARGYFCAHRLPG